MRFIALSKNDRHNGYGTLGKEGKPKQIDKVELLKSCQEYIREKKKAGQIEEAYFGSASEETRSFWYLNTESAEEMWQVLSGYPGYKVLNINWEVSPLIEMGNSFGG